MAQICAPAGCVEFARFAKVDPCTGAAIPGASNGYIVECIRNVTWNRNIEEGEKTILQTDCKKICWQNQECDDLIDYTLNFELLNPDYELQELLSSMPLITDGGGDNIGIKDVTSVDCLPWITTELFEQVPSDQCEAGYEVRRIVFPKLRFQIPENDKEGQMRILSFQGTTSPSPTAGYATGPFEDSPVDFSTASADERSHKLEFFDTIDLSTLSGNCGYITVPTPA